MSQSEFKARRLPLFAQLGWFISLRWLAGAGVITAAFADWQLSSQPHPLRTVVLGVAILVYNVALSVLLRRLPEAHRSRRLYLLTLAWAQILLDVLCLTVLTLWTGGSHSPLLGFFVLHMVFASLLLPQVMAYAAAATAMALLAAGLFAADLWPVTHDQRLHVLAWAFALLLTVFVANHITQSLRRQRRRLLRQNRRIRAMTMQLRQQQQAMVQHDKMIALGQMAAGVAHEVANPLANMDSLLQLVLRKPEKLGMETVHTLREQIERIRAIVHQMTSFSHPTESQWQEVPLNELIERSLGMLKLDARFRRVSLSFQADAEVGVVRVQPHALQQVIVNLIINALDAMQGADEPRLAVRTHRDEQMVRIDIADNGHGVAAEHLTRIFEPFFATKPVGQGTGLGLSISYALVQKQGGEITVKSTLGRGSTFTISLPAPPAGFRGGKETAAVQTLPS